MEVIARSLATLIWLIVGMFVWIPLIARSAVSLTLVYLKAAIERAPAPNLSSANKAVFSFYGDGLRWIWSDPEDTVTEKISKAKRWEHFAGAILTALIFWMPVVSIFLFFGSDDRLQSEQASSSNGYTYTGLLIEPVEGVNCRFLKGCSGEASSGRIEITEVSLHENLFADDEIQLRVRMCMNELYNLRGPHRVSAYFADHSGNSIEWPAADAGKILDGQCKVIVLSEDNDDNWGKVDLTRGTFFVTLGPRKYRASIQ